MATITYPAMNLESEKAAKRTPNRARRRRNSAAAESEHAGTTAALVGLGVLALAGAAATAWKRPAIALGGLVLGALSAGLVFERGASTR